MQRRGRSVVTGTALIVAGVLPGFLTASLASRIRQDFSFGDSALGIAVAIFYLLMHDRLDTLRPSGRARRGELGHQDRRGADGGVVPGNRGVRHFRSGAGRDPSARRARERDRRTGGERAVAADRRRPPSGFRLRRPAIGSHDRSAARRPRAAGGGDPARLALGLCRRGGAGARRGTLAPLAPAERVPDLHGSREARPRRIGSIRALAVAAALASAAGVGFVAFLVTYAIDQGIGEGAAGLLLGAVSLTATISRVGFGLVADHSDEDPLRLTALILGGSTIGYPAADRRRAGADRRGRPAVGSIGWSWPGR